MLHDSLLEISRFGLSQRYVTLFRTFLQGVESQVKDVMDLLKLQEQIVMEQWGVRKTMAEHCVQYLELEQTANEVRVRAVGRNGCMNRACMVGVERARTGGRNRAGQGVGIGLSA
jgi:hypothetical protein